MKLAKLIRDDLKNEILGILFLALALLILASFSQTSLGTVGNFIGRVLKGFFGEGRIITPVILAVIGMKLMLQRNHSTLTGKALGGLIMFIVTLTLLHLRYPIDQVFILGYKGEGGGLLGAVFSYLLQKCFGQIGTYIILLAFSLVSLSLLTSRPLSKIIEDVGQKLFRILHDIKDWLINFLFTESDEVDTENKGYSKKGEAIINDHHQFNVVADVFNNENKEYEGKKEEKIPDVSVTEKLKTERERQESMVESVEDPWNKEKQTRVHNTELLIKGEPGYQLPQLTLLSKPNHDKVAKGTNDIAEQAKKLEETFDSFSIKVKVLQIARGPAITRFEVQPPAGVKVSRIVSLSDDIALAMAATDVRIEAPIPGKAAIGIEVPNKEKSTVHLRDLLESSEFVQSTSRLTIALGQDIAGNTVAADLSKMPHLLIAGATGAGKSVCINTLIASILFKATPSEVKLLMIDPKMVELANYNGIPHLVSPVVTNAKKAATSLRWAVKEMERRYNLFAETGVRDISRYNNMIKSGPIEEREKLLPLILVIIDELADLMMVAPSDVEDAICRLAQMARAAGIHLVVATQRPSVDVITGLIKANIPSRISFMVSSQVDSRTILDMAGAEKLLGKGDMLFNPVGASKPIRVQGAFLADRDLEGLVNFLKKQAEPVYDENIDQEEEEEKEKMIIEDELLPQGVKLLIENGQASISMLQRRLHIGYARAARLIDIMEQKGIVGGYEGSKPRSILMTLDQYNIVFGNPKSTDKSDV